MAMVDMSIELLFLGLKHRQTLPIIIIDRSIVYCPDWVFMMQGHVCSVPRDGATLDSHQQG